jgi:peroxiredoxin
MMLQAGDPVPDVAVWADIREGARPLKEILGAGLALLAFYLHDWSPT